ncbi:MAG TPA: matrixin family metalloprotease, partial [Blastocatellia bacterium]|nr:matrixin family metalloprotease [Blastocatellia bacterium]
MKRYSRKLAEIALLLVVLCLLARPSTATTVVMLSDEEMVVNSRFILSGEVRSVTSAWDDSQSMIWTYVEVRAERFYKGELATKKIVLKQAGGAVGSSGIHVFGQPKFNPGQRVLLYLTTAPDGSLRVAYSFMGMYSILEDSSGRKIVTRSTGPDGVQVLAHQSQASITDQASFDDHIQNIRRTLHDESEAIELKRLEWADKPVWSVPAEYSRKKAEANVPGLEYVLIGGGIRWMEADSGQAVNYSLNSTRSPIAGGASAEIQRAMSAWTSVSGIRMQLAGQSSSCGLLADGVNTISYGDCLGQLDPATGCSGVVAQTSMRWNGEMRLIGGITFHRLIESDVVFNDGMDCFLSTSANLAEVACHELGHSIGLDHTSDSSAVMRPVAHGNGWNATLGADD